MKLDQETIEWIERAIEIAPHGKIILLTQDRRIVKIFTEGTKEIKKVDKSKNTI